MTDCVPCLFTEVLKPFSLGFVDGQENQLEFNFDASMSVLTIRKPGMNVGSDWTVTLQ